MCLCYPELVVSHLDPLSGSCHSVEIWVSLWALQERVSSWYPLGLLWWMWREHLLHPSAVLWECPGDHMVCPYWTSCLINITFLDHSRLSILYQNKAWDRVLRTKKKKKKQYTELNPGEKWRKWAEWHRHTFTKHLPCSGNRQSQIWLARAVVLILHNCDSLIQFLMTWTIKLFPLLLHNCNFATVMSLNVNIWYAGYPVQGLWPTGWERTTDIVVDKAEAFSAF